MVILQFNICQSSDCTSLTFSETTGVYDVTTNPNGWGAPNESTSDAISTTLTATLASGTIYTIDLYPTFPTSDNTFEYQIVNEDIGYITDSPITDQIITWTYTVTTSTTTYTQTIYTALYCQVQCCVNTMFANLDLDCDGCFKSQVEAATKAYTLLKGLIYSANCGNISNYNNILAQLNKLCMNSNCNNCR